ncbi:hypothetical protein GDO81_005119 [Engystomops pustulosus]|uniref:Apolipoprotein F n=1 Tax=Engystomops pustulosus TaxID=76066 RepID=A0AAV7CLM8_ENGPU|nr:hypothetical protein GDO81_005119 [Engystomops pustulosus]
MELTFHFVILFLLHPMVYSRPYDTAGTLKNGIEATDTMERLLSAEDFSWATGNQTCHQLLKDCKEFLGFLAPSSSWILKPSLALGFLQVGCLTEQDPFFLELIQDEASSKMFLIMTKQLKTSSYQTINSHKNQQHIWKLDLLRFNLESLSMHGMPPAHHIHCSGIQQEEQNFLLNGSTLGLHSSLQHARHHCISLGSVCAGISSDNMGQFKSVAKAGGYIIPHAGSKLWLHHCIGRHLRRRSTDPECQSDKELRIHNVMQWIPVVSGYYSAGSAVYYATQGCTAYAEDRAIEASVSIGYDALFGAADGISGAIGLGLGVAVKPALESGVKSAIDYFKTKLSG